MNSVAAINNGPVQASSVVAQEMDLVTQVARTVFEVTGIPLDLSRIVAGYAARFQPNYPVWQEQAPTIDGYIQYLDQLALDQRPTAFARFLSTSTWMEGVLFLTALGIHRAPEGETEILSASFGDSFPAICHSLPTELKKLNVLPYCSQFVTEECLRAIAKSCPDLEELNLSSCNQLTLAEVEVIVPSFKNLKVLNMIEGPRCTRAEAELFRAKHPRITVMSEFFRVPTQQTAYPMPRAF